ncbi:hypothetical protein ACFX11_023013 [Malus domestica]
MASPASLPQEVKPYVSVSPAGGASTQTAASPASSVGPTTSNSPCGYVNDSVQEPLQTKFGNAPNFTVPAPSLSYNVPHNANISFGTSHQLSPSSTIKSNPPAPPMGSGSLVVSVVVVSMVALTTSPSNQGSSSSTTKNDGQNLNLASDKDKFEQRFDKLRFIETLVTTHR